jgi:hypothetical protein
MVKAGVKAVTKTKKAKNYLSPWKLSPFDRGREIERLLGGMGNNFPVIDKFGKYANGVHQSVTSIKSVDLAASSYNSGTCVSN